jgi:glycosyltransferase involved in cell wall biosynthesis
MSAISPSPRSALVAILLATRNGEAFLSRQLDSLAAQSHENWQLFVSDAGSTDRSRDIIADFAARHGSGRVRCYDGPRRGFVANFLSLVCREEIAADYFAFCDQDDIWHPDKLARALAALDAAPARTDLHTHAHPARLYGGRTRLIDENGRVLGLSTVVNTPLSFAHALVQSYAGANTMVFNAAARGLLRQFGRVDGAASHDWWAYLAVSGVGGRVIYDPEPALDYRQHPGNAQGHNRGFAARFTRLRELLAGRMRGWNACHVAALEAHAGLLTAPNRATLAHFHRVLDHNGLAAVRALVASGARRQRAIDNLALGLCALLGRL